MPSQAGTRERDFKTRIRALNDGSKTDPEEIMSVDPRFAGAGAAGNDALIARPIPVQISMARLGGYLRTHPHIDSVGTHVMSGDITQLGQAVGEVEPAQ
jgi:hypothetical protein